MTKPFSLSNLVDELKTAARSDNAEAQIKLILNGAMQHPDKVLTGMPEFPDNDTILYEDETVSIWHCRFDPGYTVPAHDHQMSATIGIYSGAEKNQMYKHQSDGQLYMEKEVTLCPGDILQIGAGDIHAVNCASEAPCCGIHVYLGCLSTVERSLFDVASGEALTFTDDNYRRLTRLD